MPTSTVPCLVDNYVHFKCLSEAQLFNTSCIQFNLVLLMRYGQSPTYTSNTCRKILYDKAPVSYTHLTLPTNREV